MNATSEFRAEAQGAEPGATAGRILVWDAPVRVFHWLLVASFAGAWLTAESERWRQVHVTLGYTVAGLVVFRILWGLVGTRHARFASFVRGPSAVARYVGGMLRGKPVHYTGHNPAGALAIVALLGLALAVTASGWANLNDLGGNWLEEAHEAAASIMLAIAGVHVAGVALASWLHRENLVGAMISGLKPGLPQDGVRSAWRIVAVLMLVAVIGFWEFQWQGAPTDAAGARSPAAASAAGKHGKDTDND